MSNIKKIIIEIEDESGKDFSLVFNDFKNVDNKESGISISSSDKRYGIGNQLISRYPTGLEIKIKCDGYRYFYDCIS